MLNILITNDDGIANDGIIRLAKAAIKFGKVWVVAPDSQRSGVSHSISLHNDITVYPCEFPVDGVKAFSCSGTPADCVRIGCLNIVPKKPDVVLSGINMGYNTATDIQYSGTAGAAFEGAFQGCHSIAFSEQSGKLTEVSENYLSDILAELINKRLDYGQIYNVNFPGCSLDECKGILYDRKVSRGMFFRDTYKLIENLPDGGMRFMVEGEYNEDAEADTDFKAVVDNYVSIGVVKNIE
ncbi:MAG: 5'/3'-nucleotidase SurE [Ruminococcus sp.]|nr:5'/3'-nucleotidase SurE [Ruminococcus sp.]